ncbi:flagellar assembly protein FliH [Psychrobacillus sp. OK032]|uniref:flagellar assembly protein FliH n=1 Tax=Psychrobacillus sp. OK032 TaxID=1884358 RepID=UPI0008AB9E22|nr:flagellar assembly protein FliH [Psychrobacillus sp. OK032]SER53892.1 flagellar assembly protein FliH [Psychrobacillus sp. OK032]
MTLLSRIFRNVQVRENSEQLKPIQIKNLHIQEEIDTEQPLSLDIILKEREKMMQEIEQEIAQKKAALAYEIEENNQSIENERKAWDEQKLAFQQQAYDEAFTQGVEEGREKALSDMQNAIQIANETMQIAHENAAKYLQQQEQVILELGLRTAERIIGTKLEENDELFLSIVKRGLKEAREMKEIKLYVSPTYFALVSSNREELASLFPVDVPFMIFVDEEMNATDCFIETNHGRIVVSIDEQLQELRQKLVDMLESLE